MTGFTRYLCSDFLKRKGHPQLWLHIIIPVVGITLFLAYYSYAPWTSASKAAAYLETLAVAFPVLIGIVCSMSTEQEAAAGNFYYMLTSPVKLLPFFSMLISLIVLGFGAAALASVGFGVGFIRLLPSVPYGLDFFFYAAFVLLISNIFLYVLHLLVGLRFGKGATIGLGIVESLLSALFLTGLGEGRWQFVPCAWGARLVSGFAQCASGIYGSSYAIPQIYAGIGFCMAETIAIILFACAWFCRWEGRKSEE